MKPPFSDLSVSGERNRSYRNMKMAQNGGDVGRKIKLGVCVMEKKVKCDFEVVSALFFSNSSSES